MTDIIVEDWLDLHDKLFRPVWQPDIRRFRAQLAYRGLSDPAYDLSTSLMRLGDGSALLAKHLPVSYTHLPPPTEGPG